LVRTYPAPAQKGIEVSCTAAVTQDGKWIRLFPVPYRFLPTNRRFHKYQWIVVALKRATKDRRPESHNLNTETIKLGERIPTGRNWAARKAILKPLMRPSLCAIKRELDAKGHPTLGLFKPACIKRLVIEKCSAEWTSEQKAILSQAHLGFEKAPREELEKIPFDFSYEFQCSDPGCKGHKMICTDWEMAQSYRDWRQKHGDNWERPFREKYERDMIEKLDTHFFVGTLNAHPKNWIIVGLFYPPRSTQGELF
jgi:hypothetical protein